MTEQNPQKLVPQKLSPHKLIPHQLILLGYHNTKAEDAKILFQLFGIACAEVISI